MKLFVYILQLFVYILQLLVYILQLFVDDAISYFVIWFLDKNVSFVTV